MLSVFVPAETSLKKAAAADLAARLPSPLAPLARIAYNYA